MATNNILISEAVSVEVKNNNQTDTISNVKGLTIFAKSGNVVDVRRGKGIKSDNFECDECEHYTANFRNLTQNGYPLIKPDEDNPNKEFTERTNFCYRMIKDFQMAGVHVNGASNNPRVTYILYSVGNPSEHTTILANKSQDKKHMKKKKDEINNASLQLRNHAEVAMMDKLKADHVEGTKDNKKEIFMFINYSPCHSCVPKLIKFAENYNLKFNITFATLYRCERNSCITRFDGKCCENADSKNRKCLLTLNENVNFTLHVFKSDTWQSLRGHMCRYVTQGESNEIMFSFPNTFRSYIEINIDVRYINRDEEDKLMKKDFDIILEEEKRKNSENDDRLVSLNGMENMVMPDSDEIFTDNNGENVNAPVNNGENVNAPVNNGENVNAPVNNGENVNEPVNNGENVNAPVNNVDNEKAKMNEDGVDNGVISYALVNDLRDAEDTYEVPISNDENQMDRISNNVLRSRQPRWCHLL